MQYKKVKLFKMAKVPAGRYERKECGEGKFLQFSTTGEPVDGATEVYASALVLLPNGNVEEIHTSLIQFVDVDYEAL